MKLHVLGIDLGKTVFHMVGLDSSIAEAVQRPRMRFVPIKTEEQLDLQALHRVRERWVMRRTAVVNQIRSLLLERGLTLPRAEVIWMSNCHVSWKTLS